MYIAISADCNDNNISKMNIVTPKIKKTIITFLWFTWLKEKQFLNLLHNHKML